MPHVDGAPVPGPVDELAGLLGEADKTQTPLRLSSGFHTKSKNGDNPSHKAVALGPGEGCPGVERGQARFPLLRAQWPQFVGNPGSMGMEHASTVKSARLLDTVRTSCVAGSWPDGCSEDPRGHDQEAYNDGGWLGVQGDTQDSQDP